MKITCTSTLSDGELVATLSRLARSEREATVALIVHLAEFDARRLYEAAGFSSLFRYCRAVLHLSEDAIYNRIEAARAARRYPVIVEMLVAGSLSPTTVRMLARHLTPESHQELLAAAAGKGKDEVEEVLARRFPRADVAASVRKVPARSVAIAGPVTATSPVPDGHVEIVTPAPARESVADFAPRSRPVVRPLAPARYEVRFTATAEMREKLRLAQDLLSHAVPSGDLAQVFDRALTVLIDDLTRKKFAATPRRRRSRGQEPGSRNIPAAVRRAVVARDGGRCAFVSRSGRACASGASSSSTTSCPMPQAASPRWTTSSCAAAPTTATRCASSSDPASAMGAERSRAKSRRWTEASRQLVLERVLRLQGSPKGGTAAYTGREGWTREAPMATKHDAPDTAIAWTHDLDKALDHARQTARHVLLDFTAAPL